MNCRGLQRRTLVGRNPPACCFKCRWQIGHGACCQGRNQLWAIACAAPLDGQLQGSEGSSSSAAAAAASSGGRDRQRCRMIMLRWYYR